MKQAITNPANIADQALANAINIIGIGPAVGPFTACQQADEAMQSPAIRLAAAMVDSGVVAVAAIGDMLADIEASSDPLKRAATLAEDFSAEYANRQADPTKKGAKAVRAARTSDLRAVFKAFIALPEFKAMAQQGIDNGSIQGLQAMAKLARAMMKPPKASDPCEVGSEGDGTEADEAAELSGVPLVRAQLEKALHSAVSAELLTIASQIRAIIAEL